MAEVIKIDKVVPVVEAIVSVTLKLSYNEAILLRDILVCIGGDTPRRYLADDVLSTITEAVGGWDYRPEADDLRGEALIFQEIING